MTNPIFHRLAEEMASRSRSTGVVVIYLGDKDNLGDVVVVYHEDPLERMRLSQKVPAIFKAME